MAITFRSATSVANANRTNTTATQPAGAAAGDVYVAVFDVGNSSAPAVTGPAGWTLAATLTYTAADPWGVRFQVWTATYASAASWTWLHSSGYSQIHVAAWQGVDNTTPLDTTPSTATGSSPFGGNATAAAITTATALARLILARGSWDGNAITPPAGWTERYDAPVSWVGDMEDATPGSTGTVSVGSGNTGDPAKPWGVILAALRPAGEASNSGTLSANLPKLTGAITGSATNPGTLDATVPGVTAALTGTQTNPGTLAASLPPPTGSLLGTQTNPGTLDGQIPKLLGAITDQTVNTATLAATIPKALGALTGQSINPAALTGPLPTLTGTIAGTSHNPAALAAATPALTGALAGTALNPGTLAGTTPRLVGSIIARGAYRDLHLTAGPTTGPRIQPGPTTGPRITTGPTGG